VNRLVFLLEELSMRVLLEGLLPRALPGLCFQCIVHDGKSDLEKNVSRRLRAWREPGVRFMIVRDNDGAECRRLKDSLVELVPDERRSQTLVRLACQELEAWYFGEPSALARAFDQPELANVGARARFRDPDSIQEPSAALAELAPAFQKVSGARAMGRLLDPDDNGSRSFRAFLDGVRRLADS
jgi:hypothetical protein